jgi:hypothetical protein
MHHYKRHSNTLALLILTLVIVAWMHSPATAQNLSDENLAAAVNEMLEKTYKSDEPGAAVIVMSLVFR